MVGIIENPATLQSAAGLLALLDEPDHAIQHYALNNLNAVVDVFWAQISDDISKIEIFTEDDTHPDKHLAALVASKVYYHLGFLDESMTFALRAGDLFDTDAKTEYAQTIIAHCIDQYTSHCQQDKDASEALSTVVEKMVARCFKDGEFKQAIGVAMESRRLDIVETAMAKSPEDLKGYVLDVAMDIVQNLDFRNRTLRLLVDLYLKDEEPDYFSVSKCVVHLDDSTTAADLLNSLAEKDHEKKLLMAYQIAFDLDSSATQNFLSSVQGQLTTESPDITRIKSILAGEETIKLNLEFLNRNDRTDILILNKTKDSLEARNSIFHSSVTFANAFMHAGTTSDGFFRNNLEWLSKATNWSKFSATAALGVIHRGNLSSGMRLLGPYLPQEGMGGGSPYSQGGSLFALGLIYTNHGANVLDYLRQQFKNTTDETVQHGAALGIGVAGMATGSDDIYEELKNVLFSDSAIAGEAVGLSIGLVMLGSASQKSIDEMLQYAHETQHEKIIRGLAIGLSLLMYAKEDVADGLIQQLLGEQDPILRYGGIFTVAMAYCGTGNNDAIRKVLHVAVSDVSDDVRRAAVMSLGFIMFRNYKAVPRMVELLAESYNPHVRYGSALALGISCAGTGLAEAIEMLEPLVKDPTDFVRQGALVSLAMILIQQNDTNSKVTQVRKMFEKIIGEKHEDAMAKFGAVIAQGIIDAGGRNVTIGLQSGASSLNVQAVVGMLIFTQFWFWFPLTHFLSLAFTPTAIIGLNKDLKIPEMKLWSNARPSLFEYPPKTEVSTDKAPEKVATAVLSTTARAKARAKKVKAEKEGFPMETDQPAKDIKEPEKMDVDTDKSEKSEKPQDKKEKKEAEKPGFEIENLSRVLPQYLPTISFPEASRYQPVKKFSGGVLLLHDQRPDEEEKIIEITHRASTSETQSQTPEAREDVAPMPEEFIYETDTEL